MGNFKNVLKQLRLNNKWTQDELADRLGISRSAISMYERGEREPDFETLEMIADFFNIDMNYLHGMTDQTTVLNQSYYLNKDSQEAAQFLYENPNYKVLFDASRKVKPEDIDFVKQMIDKMNGNN